MESSTFCEAHLVLDHWLMTDSPSLDSDLFKAVEVCSKLYSVLSELNPNSVDLGTKLSDTVKEFVDTPLLQIGVDQVLCANTVVFVVSSLCSNFLFPHHFTANVTIKSALCVRVFSTRKVPTAAGLLIVVFKTDLSLAVN